jgi:hypothetical protein
MTPPSFGVFECEPPMGFDNEGDGLGGRAGAINNGTNRPHRESYTGLAARPPADQRRLAACASNRSSLAFSNRAAPIAA